MKVRTSYKSQENQSIAIKLIVIRKLKKSYLLLILCFNDILEGKKNPKPNNLLLRTQHGFLKKKTTLKQATTLKRYCNVTFSLAGTRRKEIPSLLLHQSSSPQVCQRNPLQDCGVQLD